MGPGQIPAPLLGALMHHAYVTLDLTTLGLTSSSNAVSLKILPAAQMDGGLRATTASGRSVFAHLKLRASPIEYDALHHSPTIRALGCAD